MGQRNAGALALPRFLSASPAHQRHYDVRRIDAHQRRGDRVGHCNHNSLKSKGNLGYAFGYAYAGLCIGLPWARLNREPFQCKDRRETRQSLRILHGPAACSIPVVVLGFCRFRLIRLSMRIGGRLGTRFQDRCNRPLCHPSVRAFSHFGGRSPIPDMPRGMPVRHTTGRPTNGRSAPAGPPSGLDKVWTVLVRGQRGVKLHLPDIRLV